MTLHENNISNLFIFQYHLLCKRYQRSFEGLIPIHITLHNYANLVLIAISGGLDACKPQTQHIYFSLISCTLVTGLQLEIAQFSPSHNQTFYTPSFPKTAKGIYLQIYIGYKSYNNKSKISLLIPTTATIRSTTIKKPQMHV